jgi:hypothetical protein
MGNVLDDLAIYINSQNSSFTIGDTLSKGRYGARSPATCVALIEVISFEPPIDTFGASGSFGGWERPQIQVLSRSSKYDYQTARTNAETVYKILRSVYNTTTGINGTNYHYIKVRSSPYYQGEDDNSRHLISFTVDCWKDTSS